MKQTAAAILIGLMSAAMAHAAQKIAVCDMNRVFREYYKTADADARLDEQVEEYTAEQEKMAARKEALQQDFESAREDSWNKALSEEERSRRRSDAEEALLSLKEFDAQMRETAAQRKKELTDQSRRIRQRLVDEIREVVSQYAREQAFDLVLDSAGMGMAMVEVVLYHHDSLDVTDPILLILNRDRPDHTAPRATSPLSLDPDALDAPMPEQE